MKQQQSYSISVDPRTFQMTIRRLIWPSAAPRGTHTSRSGRGMPACFVPIETDGTGDMGEADGADATDTTDTTDALARLEADAQYERDKREAAGFGFTFGEDILLTEAEAAEIRAGKTPARLQTPPFQGAARARR